MYFGIPLVSSILRTTINCPRQVFKLTFSTSFPGSKIEVDGYEIHYEKVGNGDHALLLLPGALGSTQSDFKPQLDHLNREKLTVVAWDPPGYGFSRPPNRKWDLDMLYTDARIANNLMKKLGYAKFSVVGWSDGAVSALIVASKYPEFVQKLIIFGVNCYVTDGEAEIYEAVKDISKWSDRMKEPMIKMYGLQHFKDMWENWCDFSIDIKRKRNGNHCKELVPYIKCPTLIIHGEKDNYVFREHPEYLNRNIENSKLKYYPHGKHNLHLKFWKEFNADVENFLLN